jgi:hypothetical protein
MIAPNSAAVQVQVEQRVLGAERVPDEQRQQDQARDQWHEHLGGGEAVRDADLGKAVGQKWQRGCHQREPAPVEARRIGHQARGRQDPQREHHREDADRQVHVEDQPPAAG